MPSWSLVERKPETAEEGRDWKQMTPETELVGLTSCKTAAASGPGGLAPQDQNHQHETRRPTREVLSFWAIEWHESQKL